VDSADIWHGCVEGDDACDGFDEVLTDWETIEALKGSGARRKFLAY
jgi:hypothetical protein